jgi:hypothetical protein
MKFVAPEMEVKMFSAEDVLTTSAATEATTFQGECEAELPLM